MGPSPHKRTMHQPAVFRIYIQGSLDDSWTEYFEIRTITTGSDDAGVPTTVLTTGLMDQAALVGFINRLNSLGLPLLSVEHLPEE